MAEFRDVSTVVSLLPIPLREHKPGLNPAEYFMKAVKDPSKMCEVLLVKRAQFPVYIDENRPALIVPEPSDRVAAAICRDYKVSSSHFNPGVAEPGLFWLPGEFTMKDILVGPNEEAEKELSRARVMQMEWFKLQIAEADDLWGHYHQRKMISGIQKAAARVLNLDKDWNIESEIRDALSVCKFCYSQVNPQAMICPACNGILDMERYKREFAAADLVKK